MKTNWYLPLVTLFFLTVVSCAKKETTTGGSGTGAGGSTSTILDFSNCYGAIYFEEHTNIDKYGDVSVIKSPITARFYMQPVLNINKQDLDVGTVSVNGIGLKRNGVGGFVSKSYSDTTNQLFSLSAFTLDASGTSSVSKFQLRYSGGSVVFLDTNLLPAMFSRSEGINLTFTQFGNADSLVFSLAKDHYRSLTKALLVKGKDKINIKLTREEVINLMENYTDGTFTITVFKKVLVRTGNRDYLVQSRKVYTKPVMVSFF